MSEEYIESKPKTFKFGAPGDFIKGTLTGITKTSTPDQYGKLSYIYSVKAKEGSFYGSTKNEKTKKWVMDTEQTIINDGEEYTVFIPEDKQVIIGKMKDIRIGQKFMIKFDEVKPTTKGNDAKIIKVFPAYLDSNKTQPAMDQEWIDSTKTVEEKFEEM